MKVIFQVFFLFFSSIVVYGQCESLKIDLGADKIICKNDDVVINSTITNLPKDSIIIYKWFFNDVLVSGQTGNKYQISNFDISKNGVYKVEAKVAGCVLIDEVSIKNISSFDITTNNNKIYACIGASIIFPVDIVNNFGFSSQQTWTGPNSFSTTSQNLSLTNIQEKDKGIYTITSTIGSCSKTKSVNLVVIYPEIVGNSVQDYNSEKWLVKCTSPGNRTGNIFITNGLLLENYPNVSEYNINWGDNKDTTIYDDSWELLKHQYPLGLYTLNLTLKTVSGCSISKQYNVFVGNQPASPQIRLPSSAQGCSPLSLTFPISGYIDNIPGTTYTVKFSDGSPDLKFDQKTIPSSITKTFTSSSCGSSFTNGELTESNAFGATIQAVNPCGSSSSSAGPVRTSQPPIVDFEMISKECVNKLVSINNISDPGVIVTAQGCVKNYSYYWKITPADGWVLASGSRLGSANDSDDDFEGWLIGSKNLNITFTKPGKYQINLIGKNSCFDKSEKIKEICIVSPPQPTFTTNFTSGCAPLTATLSNTSTEVSQCEEISKSWIISKISNGCIDNSSTDYDFVLGTNSSSENPKIQFNNEGVYEIKLKLTNYCGVFYSAIKYINISAKPKVSISVPTAICFYLPVIPSASVQSCGSPITSYKWFFNSGNPNNSSSLDAPSVTYNTSGNKTIRLEVINSCGTSSDSKSFEVLSPPSVDAGIDKSTCSGESISIGNSPNSNLSYSWTPSNGLSLSNSLVTNLTLINSSNLPADFKYIVTATDINNFKKK